MARNIILIPSASYTTTQTASATNTTEVGVKVVIDLTGSGAFISVVVEGFDQTSGKWYELGSIGSDNQIRTRLIRIHPALTPDTGPLLDKSFSAVVPLTWRVVATPSSGTATTYSVGAFVY